MLFEQGPIRPPSEANSLLIRTTRNCPWNRCRFCITYKGTSFSRRPVEEVKAEIVRIKKMSEQILALSRTMGCNGVVTAQVANRIYQEHGIYYFYVARWLHYGGKTVFLQDANTLIMKTADLIEVLRFLQECFPTIERITCYARASSAVRKTPDELAALRAAGLSRIHVGLESGCDEVLSYMDKGATAAIQIEAGRKIKEAGISLCQYVMPGLGGRRWMHEHPLDTAAVINAVNPDHIRLRTLAVLPDTPLYELMEKGDFEPLSEDEVINEIRVLVENLQGINSHLVSDHFRNLLEEVSGCLPADKESMLAATDRYLALPGQERLNFQLGRRLGLYRYLSDMTDRGLYERVSQRLKILEAEGRLKEVMFLLQQQAL